LDPLQDHEFFAPLTERYQRLVERRGVQPESAARWITTRHGIAAAMLLDAGEVDAALCGGWATGRASLPTSCPSFPRLPGVTRLYSLSALILPNGALFLLRHPCQCRSQRRTDRRDDPAPRQDRAPLPGSRQSPRCCPIPASAPRIRPAPSRCARRWRLLHAAKLDFEIDGEMHADAALSESLRARVVSNSPLTGSANLLVMPTLDAANIALTLLSAATEALL